MLNVMSKHRRREMCEREVWGRYQVIDRGCADGINEVDGKLKDEDYEE